jgi:hypothetical protein
MWNLRKGNGHGCINILFASFNVILVLHHSKQPIPSLLSLRLSGRRDIAEASEGPLYKRSKELPLQPSLFSLSNEPLSQLAVPGLYHSHRITFTSLPGSATKQHKTHLTECYSSQLQHNSVSSIRYLPTTQDAAREIQLENSFSTSQVQPLPKAPNRAPLENMASS